MSTENNSTWPSLSKGIIALCLLISLAGIVNHELWTPDEPREAALALEMSRTGDIIIPRLAGEAFVEKPPLFYWLGAAAISGLGQWLGNTFAIRLTSALWGLGTLAIIYLLARRLWDARSGLVALLVLAVMPGFVHVTHWILVDNALMFFVAGACWCLAEAYIGEKFYWLPWAGLFGAGAFLSKGLLGPAVVSLGGIGLLSAWVKRHGWAYLFSARSLAWHALALALLTGLALTWVLVFRQVGSPELWRAWFWDNQVGRFCGQITALGHRQWIGYYLGVLPLYLLPWLLAWLISLGQVCRRIWRREALEPAWFLLLGWGLGGLALLTISSTKREIYLSVLLPAFSLMVVPVLREPLSAWIRFSLRVWAWLMGLVLVAMVLAPLFGVQYGMPAIERRCYFALALGFLAIALVGLTRRQFAWLRQWALVTALAYIASLSILLPLLDPLKNYAPAFRTMAQQIQRDPQASLAAWNFDETTRAGFYYYCDLIFPALSDNSELYSILEGKHPRFNGILTLSKGFPPANLQWPPWRVHEIVRMGISRRLEWVTADPENRNITKHE